MSDSTDPAAELRVLHWNIHSWLDADGAPNSAAVTALIDETRPHVVSLVEVNEPLGAPRTLSEVADKCGYSWIFVPSIEFGVDPAARGYGNALLTKVPVLAVQHRRVYTPDGGYERTEPTETRSVTLVRVRFYDTSLWLGSTHFPATHHGSRETAARALKQLMLDLAASWIICGDFNAPHWSLFGDRDDIQAHPESGEPTYPASLPVVPIDYALASPGIVMRTEVLRRTGSDHLPLLTVARFP